MPNTIEIGKKKYARMYCKNCGSSILVHETEKHELGIMGMKEIDEEKICCSKTDTYYWFGFPKSERN